MKKCLFVCVSFVFSVFFSIGHTYAANTVTVTGNVIEITDIDSDWSWSDSFPSHESLPIGAVIFKPGAADDQCVLEEATTSGASFFDVTASDEYSEKGMNFSGARLRPVLDFSDGTYSAGSKVIIIINDK